MAWKASNLADAKNNQSKRAKPEEILGIDEYFQH
jgi:hypothetical protein